MTTVLPKKRSAQQQSSHNTAAILHDLSNKGRVISNRAVSSSKRKPSGVRHVSRGEMFVARNDDPNSSFGEDAIHFHENRSTIMSNFEEWIKLSTDNKITLKNSWQFALIDYFHDLNVIKDGENINFQRASATLDGCVKIYLSRVESAASETGKLLSGLATKKGQLELETEDGDENDSGKEDDDETTGKKKERRINRIVESTLVPYESIQIQKLDQELAIDPLFKKALADFDEGGAKSLLLNTLNIDSTGRVVFDATTNSTTNTGLTEAEVEEQTDETVPMAVDQPAVDISRLKQLLFGEKEDLNGLSLCPSIKELKEVLNDVNKAKSVLGDVNNRFMAESQEDQAPAVDTPANFPDFGDDVDLDLNMGPGIDYDAELAQAGVEGEENEYLNQPTGIEAPISKAIDFANLSLEDEVATEKVMDKDLMAYFDEKMKTNWRGPEHWRISMLKQSKNLEESRMSRGTTPLGEPNKKKKKEAVEIDFFAEDDDPDFIEDMFVKARNQFLITKKPEERKSSDLHILPDDIQFNSQRLVNLFIKPSKTIVTFTRKKLIAGALDAETGDVNRTYTDERFFAEKYVEREKEREEETRQERLARSFHMAEMDDYDNDNYGDINFNDALGDANTAVGDGDDDEKKEDIGSQFVTGTQKVRPEYVNFSRVAKRVDVKLLKDNLWKSIKEENESAVDEPQKDPASGAVVAIAREKNFKDVVGSIGTMYRPDEKKDLSTSFCFICLLHLANEHGLSIEANDQHDDLFITGF